MNICPYMGKKAKRACKRSYSAIAAYLASCPEFLNAGAFTGLVLVDVYEHVSLSSLVITIHEWVGSSVPQGYTPGLHPCRWMSMTQLRVFWVWDYFRAYRA